MKYKIAALCCMVLCMLLFVSGIVRVPQPTVSSEAETATAGPEATPTPTPTPAPTISLAPLPEAEVQEPLWTQQEIEMLAKTIWAEARGVPSTARQAAVVWCVLNRLDAGGYGDTIAEVVSAPYQFAYSPDNPLSGEYIVLAEDVLLRWGAEKAGVEDVGRTLPADYLFFEGDGYENHFRKEYGKTGETWDWSLPDPYGGR